MLQRVESAEVNNPGSDLTVQRINTMWARRRYAFTLTLNNSGNLTSPWPSPIGIASDENIITNVTVLNLEVVSNIKSANILFALNTALITDWN